MLDADLAAIYGYETKYFNRQVSNNIEKFEGDAFMFQLTREELDELVRCKNFTSRDNRFFQGQSGGTRYLPRVFTEVGVYMLMTVLKGDIAVRQSRALVLAFKEMKDYLMAGLIPAQDMARLSVQTAENTSAIRRIEHKLTKVVLFGSYGWGDGQWMRDWEARTKTAGATLAADCVMANETPDDAALASCRALGAALA